MVSSLGAKLVISGVMVSQLSVVLLNLLADSCHDASERGPFLLTFSTPLGVSRGDHALKLTLFSHRIDLARRETSPLKTTSP